MKVSFMRKSASMTVTFILGALTFVAAMAWNDAVKEFVEKNPSLKQHGLLVYALIATAAAIIISIAIGPFQIIDPPDCGCNTTS